MAVEAPRGPSEEDAADAAADNANFGPQDVVVVPSEDNEVVPAGDVVYNVLVNVPNTVPADADEVEGLASYSDVAYGAGQEWDVGDNTNTGNVPHATIEPVKPAKPKPDEPVPTNAVVHPPAVRTRSGRHVQRRDI